MELNMKERITILNVLPEKGNYETMSTIERIRTKLFPSEEEVTEFDIKQNGATVTWNSAGDNKKEMGLSETQVSFIGSKLDELSSKGDLNYDQYLILKMIKEKSN